MGEIPLKARNTLRSSRDPFAHISALRQTLSPDQLPSLVSWLSKFGLRARLFNESRRPRKISALRGERRILAPLILSKEIIWATSTFRIYKDHLQEFIQIRDDYNRSLLENGYEDALAILDQAEQSLGISLWLIENRVALLQLSQGLEAQKTYLRQLREELRSPTAEFIAYMLSRRNEETTNPENFRLELIHGLPSSTTNPEFARYALFRLTDHWPKSEASVASILRWEYNSSVVDYYDTFVRLMTRLLSLPRGSFPWICGTLKDVALTLHDDRITRLLSLSTGDFEALSATLTSDSLAADAYYAGSFDAALDVLERGRLHRNAASPVIAALSMVDSCKPAEFVIQPTLWHHLVGLLTTIAAKSGKYMEAHAELLRIATNLHSSHFAAYVADFTKRLVSSDMHPDRPLMLESAVNGQGVLSHALGSVPPEIRSGLAAIILAIDPDSLSIKAEVSRNTEGSSVPLPVGISPELALEIRLDQAWQEEEFPKVVQLGLTVNANSSSRHRRHVRRAVANAYMIYDVPHAVEFIVQSYLEDPESLPQLPLAKCVESLNENLLQDIAAKPSTPIIMELYSREVEDRPTEIRYAHEDFLAAHSIERPSEIVPLLMTFERTQLVHYLRFVCVPRVIQLCSVFESSRSVENERVAVCSLLKELDPASQAVYDAEIREITRRQSISYGLRQVEKSKIWIDEEPLKSWAERNLKEGFLRYQALRSAGLASNESEALSDSKITSVTEEAGKLSEVPELPVNEVDALLKSMVTQFVAQCFLNRQHGLNTYLSLRIRHGVLSGQLRAPLEQERIITSRKEAESGEYAPNEYWLERIYPFDPGLAVAVNRRLSQFSREFDDLVDAFINERIQVKRDERAKALFVAGYVPEKLVLMASDIHSDTTFDGFLDLCIGVFWDSVDRSLQQVRCFIDEEFLPSIDATFLSLIKDIENIDSRYGTPELDNAVRTAHTQVRNAIAQVEDWFREPSSTTASVATFRSLVDIGLAAVKNMYRDFNPDVTYDLGDLPLTFQLQKFTDLFIIIFANIWRHCGLLSPKVTVSVRQDERSLQLEFSNECAEGIRNSESEKRIEEIKTKIAEGSYHRALGSEGGTGLMKLKNIFSSSSDEAASVEFGFFSSQTFTVRVRASITIVSVESSEVLR